MKPLRMHPAARQEMSAARAWYMWESPQAADHFIEELLPALDRIPIWPNLPPLYLFGTRRIILSRFPFSVVYKEWPSTIQIIAIAHQKRRPGYWKNRI